MMEKKHNCKKWAKEHKAGLVCGGLAVGIVVAVVVAKPDLLKRIVSQVRLGKSGIPQVAPAAIQETAETAASLIPDEILEHRGGERLTATGLGDLVGMSAQAINKKLEDAGLQKRMPNGDWCPTAAGKLLAEETSKLTKCGHWFNNNEWYSCVLEVIFTPGELQAFAEHRAIVQRIIDGQAS